MIQWHWQAAEGPGESKSDTEIVATLFQTLKGMYGKDGGKLPEPILNLSWPYRIANRPSPEELLMEISGKALGDVFDPKDKTKVIVKAGDKLCISSKRWIHILRQLDLQWLLVAGGQSGGASRQFRSFGPRADPQLGLRLAGQPAHPL